MPGASNAFVIYKSSDRQYYFVLKAGNSEIIATSETYTTNQSAKDGIAAVKRVAPNATIVDMADPK